MPNDEVIKPKLCPEFPVAVQQGLGGAPKLTGGIPCIGDQCAKYQVCQVLPMTMAEILNTLKERLP